MNVETIKCTQSIPSIRKSFQVGWEKFKESRMNLTFQSHTGDQHSTAARSKQAFTLVFTEDCVICTLITSETSNQFGKIENMRGTQPKTSSSFETVLQICTDFVNYKLKQTKRFNSTREKKLTETWCNRRRKERYTLANKWWEHWNRFFFWTQRIVLAKWCSTLSLFGGWFVFECHKSNVSFFAQDMEMLKSYNPWGRPGGGAPIYIYSVSILFSAVWCKEAMSWTWNSVSFWTGNPKIHVLCKTKKSAAVWTYEQLFCEQNLFSFNATLGKK